VNRRLRRGRLAVAVAATAAVLSVSACGNGFDAITNIEYEPADGISLDTETVDVRNLTIVSDPGVDPWISATLINTGSEADVLIGAQAGATTGQLDSGEGVEVGPSGTVVLGAASPRISFPAAVIEPGTWVPVTLVFAEGGEVSGDTLVRTTVLVPPTSAPHGEGEGESHSEGETAAEGETVAEGESHSEG
jgi:hypothetical protein